MTQDSIPGLAETGRHPMWTKPYDPEGRVADHIVRLRTTIWSTLQPFDGRPNSDEPIKFAQDVHFLTTRETAHDSIEWLVMRVLVAKRDHLHRLDRQLHPLLTTDRMVVARMAEQYVDALIAYVR